MRRAWAFIAILGISLGSPGVLRALMQPDAGSCCTSLCCCMHHMDPHRTPAAQRADSASCPMASGHGMKPGATCTCMMNMDEQVKAWAAHADFQFDLTHPALLPRLTASAAGAPPIAAFAPGGHLSLPEHPPRTR